MYQDWMDKIPVIEDINNCNNVSRMDESMPIIISDDIYIYIILKKNKKLLTFNLKCVIINTS